MNPPKINLHFRQKIGQRTTANEGTILLGIVTKMKKDLVFRLLRYIFTL